MRFFVYPYVIYTQYQRFKSSIEQFELKTFSDFRDYPNIQEMFSRYSISEKVAQQMWKDLSNWTSSYMVIHVTCPSNSSLPFCTWKDLSAALYDVEAILGLRFFKMTRVVANSNGSTTWCIEFKKREFSTFGTKYPALVKKANTPFFQYMA